MPNYNKVILAGNLTRDPETNFTSQGTAVCKFSIAVNRQTKDADGNKKQEVDFFNIVAWSKTAEVAGKYLAKGQCVLVEGRLQTRSYETQDHQKRTVTEIVVERLEFLTPKKREEDPAQTDSDEPPADDGGTIPF